MIGMVLKPRFLNNEVPEPSGRSNWSRHRVVHCQNADGRQSQGPGVGRLSALVLWHVLAISGTPYKSSFGTNHHGIRAEKLHVALILGPEVEYRSGT